MKLKTLKFSKKNISNIDKKKNKKKKKTNLEVVFPSLVIDVTHNCLKIYSLCSNAVFTNFGALHLKELEEFHALGFFSDQWLVINGG